jgi:hypothetical protein
VQRHHANAADRTRPQQDDLVGLACQDITSGQCMFRDKSVDWLLPPRRPDAICQIEGTSDLAIEAVDVQGDAAHTGIGQRGLQLGRDPLIGGQARGLPDPRAAMDQRSGDFDDRNAIHQSVRLCSISLIALGKVISEQRGAGRQSGCGLLRSVDFQLLEADFPPGDAGPTPDRNASAFAGSTISGVLKARWAIWA